LGSTPSAFQAGWPLISSAALLPTTVSAAGGPFELADVAFLALQEVRLVASRPGPLARGQLGAEVDARVVHLGLPGLPLQLEREVAVAVVAAHEAVARFQHQRPAFGRRLALGDLPAVEVLAVEQRPRIAGRLVGTQRGG
jgi:hypothetical protein